MHLCHSRPDLNLSLVSRYKDLRDHISDKDNRHYPSRIVLRSPNYFSKEETDSQDLQVDI